ncbi:GGDEF domain-containing protein [Halomonas sp. MCCC 1A17488]|uniref:GGDEF domain-containing protein n=1 Tax=unclassified Halomonas TaxID=2609666 RepID=UPI0018D2012A|nr:MULTISPECIES: GGDEF domain-containing protein [unclassified Halomonas]MCE8015185.1 GGDEF domain-containing protein [Halomonas sp. MCCC 1A17488]MCG3238518.1 GGDEF domain-containing protein [Halomonas sp. MCCC 1A17488]QPP47741.1 GGDEF domain-containing protein [Halomonas sp. SS10-MC5]
MRCLDLPLRLFAPLVLLFFPVVAAATSSLDLDSGWEYRWGDSPTLEDGTPVWLVTDDEAAWQAIDFPSNPPGRDGNHHAWFRITLPDGEWRDLVLYIYSIDLIAQAFLDTEPIYQHGNFDARGQGPFIGWPWHVISLPEDFGGRQLAFRVYSNYTDIGLWGEVRLMDRPEFFAMILNRSAADLVVSAFCLLLALLAGSFALIHQRRQTFAGIGLFSLASGVMILAETQASQLLLATPLLWDYLAAAGYYALPVGIGLLLEPWFTNRLSRWIRRLWQLHLGYLVLALGLALSGVINLSSTFPVFDALLATSLPVLFALIAGHLKRLNGEQRLVIAAYGLFALLLLLDMAVAHGLLPWQRIPVSLGALGFSLAIVAISLRHYVLTQRELIGLNQRLEQQVADRTQDLQHMVEQLRAFSYQDPLTGLKNRRHFDEVFAHEAASARRGGALTLVMLDIDHFKHFNDLYGHDAGDAVLTATARLIGEHFREADVVCRLGGEEFVVIMPGATAQQASEAVERLLASMREQSFLHGGEALGCVSLSCGIASYPTHADDPTELVRLADMALYRAKHCGRDRSETYAPST